MAGTGRALGLAVLATFVLAVVAVPARAEIQLIESSEAATELGKIRKGKCKVRRTSNGEKYFGAIAESTNGRWELTVLVDRGFWGGYREEYSLFYGVAEINVALLDLSTDTAYSTSYSIPGTPPGVVGAGGLKFSGGGRKLGVGAYSVPSQDFTRGVAVAGRMKCKAPRRRR